MSFPRQPAGTSSGGQFAAKPHAEADIVLDDLGLDLSIDRSPPGRSPYRSYEPPTWDGRPAHDMMTEMAPDLAAHFRGLRGAGQTPPDGVSNRDWYRDLSKLEAAFESVNSLKTESFFDPVDGARFDDAMDVMRRHGHDGRLAAHTSSTVTGGLNRFADHLADRRLKSFQIIEEEYGEIRPDLLEPSEREVEVRECAAAFEQAGRDYINGVDTQESRERTEAAANWLADNYLRLWT